MRHFGGSHEGNGSNSGSCETVPGLYLHTQDCVPHEAPSRYIGHKPQLGVMGKMISASAQGKIVEPVCLFGHPQCGKTSFCWECLRTSPEGSLLCILDCPRAVRYSSVSEACAEICRLVEYERDDGGLVLVFCDEVDRVAPKRAVNDSTLRSTVDIMDMLNEVQKHHHVLTFMISNVPELIDHAVIHRTPNAIHLPLPGRDFLKEALMEFGFSKDAEEISKTWDWLMHSQGLYWSGSCIIAAIKENCSDIVGEAPSDAARLLQQRVRGNPIKDPHAYISQPALRPFAVAARRTTSYFIGR